MEHSSTVDIGQRKNRTGGINEDSITTAVFENYHRQTGQPLGVFVLGDGVGGEASGDVASFLATTIIRKKIVESLVGTRTDLTDEFEIDAYEDTPPTWGDEGVRDEQADPIPEEQVYSMIQDAANEAHKYIQDFASDINGRPATTIVVAVYFDSCLYYGWAGDSRAYAISSKHDSIQQLTKDHAATNELLEEGEIQDEVYARIHEKSTAVTRVLGGSAYGSPEIEMDFNSINVYKDDTVLITSDGLIDAFPDIRTLRKKYQEATDKDEIRKKILDSLVTDDEIKDIILDADSLSNGVDRLVEFANERGGKDNLSIALFSDSKAPDSPDSLPPRGTIEEQEKPLTQQETVIEPALDPDKQENQAKRDSDDASNDSEDDQQIPPEGDQGEDYRTERERSEMKNNNGCNKNRFSDESTQTDSNIGSSKGSHRDLPEAAIFIRNIGESYSIKPQDTIGLSDENGSGDPDIGLILDREVSIEAEQARFEYDEAGYWRIRDLSSSGTYIRHPDDDWKYLLSNDELDNREHGISHESEDSQPNEAYRLQNGTIVSLQNPEENEPIQIEFYLSLDDVPDTGRDDSNRFLDQIL